MLLAQARSNAKQFVHVSDDSVWFFSLVTLFAKKCATEFNAQKAGLHCLFASLHFLIRSNANSCLCLVLHGLL